MRHKVALSILGASTRETVQKLEKTFPESKKPKRLEIQPSPELESKLEELKALLSQESSEALIEKLAISPQHSKTPFVYATKTTVPSKAQEAKCVELDITLNSNTSYPTHGVARTLLKI